MWEISKRFIQQPSGSTTTVATLCKVVFVRLSAFSLLYSTSRKYSLPFWWRFTPYCFRQPAYDNLLHITCHENRTVKIRWRTASQNAVLLKLWRNYAEATIDGKGKKTRINFIGRIDFELFGIATTLHSQSEVSPRAPLLECDFVKFKCLVLQPRISNDGVNKDSISH